MASHHAIDLQFWQDGPAPGAFYQMRQAPRPVASTAAAADPRKHTMNPSVTGTSVLGVACSDGVVMAADMLGSYGSLARFRDVKRLFSVSDATVVGVSGDVADGRAIEDLLEDLVRENDFNDDGHRLTPKGIFTYMTRVLYNRRSKMNPLWNTVLVGGLKDGKGFLGYVDKVGVAYEDPTIATGYGAHIALPLLRNAIEANPAITVAEATAVIHKCMKVLFYRDARSLNKYQVAAITADKIDITGPHVADTEWEIASMVRGYE